jgi:hypothetical protein
LLFFENHFGALSRSSYESYVKILKEFVKGGPVMWRKFAFFCFNLGGNDKLCEHDMFGILEQFKLREFV